MGGNQTQTAQWICCQLGAREHYSIPRALHQSGQLQQLITDAWVEPSSPIRYLPNKAFKSLGDRHHPELSNAKITAFTNSLLKFELQQRLQKTKSWDRMIARNNWFQKKVIKTLDKILFQVDQKDENIILFTYSYAALEILRYAKSRGWITILGQIDPGIYEEKIVIQEQQKYPNLAPQWEPVPANYWKNWQQECALADHIIVNSRWSKQLLAQTKINTEKIHIVPLVYTPPAAAQNFQRTYPVAFSQDRPLRVLFLGLVTLRKGIAACLEAIQELSEESIEFWFVGAQQIQIPENLQNHPQIRWFGPVPRSEIAQYYRAADVFLFPTLSDGFGLTQLEAQAWQLPSIVSKCCGDVAQDQVNGVVLDNINGSAIAEALLSFKNKPEQLEKFAQNIKPDQQFSIKILGESLQNFTSII